MFTSRGILPRLFQRTPPKMLFRVSQKYNLDFFKNNHRTYLEIPSGISLKILLDIFKEVLGTPELDSVRIPVSSLVYHPRFTLRTFPKKPLEDLLE